MWQGNTQHRLHAWVEAAGMRRATGATALVKLGAPSADELGFAKSLKVAEIGGANVLVLEQVRRTVRAEAWLLHVVCHGRPLPLLGRPGCLQPRRPQHLRPGYCSLA